MCGKQSRVARVRFFSCSQCGEGVKTEVETASGRHRDANPSASNPPYRPLPCGGFCFGVAVFLCCFRLRCLPVRGAVSQQPDGFLTNAQQSASVAHQLMAMVSLEVVPLDADAPQKIGRPALA